MFRSSKLNRLYSLLTASKHQADHVGEDKDKEGDMCRAINHRFACGHADTEHQVCEKVHERQKKWAREQAKKKEKNKGGSGWSCCGLGGAGEDGPPPPEPCRSPQASNFFRGSQVCRNCDRRRRPLPPNPNPPSSSSSSRAGRGGGGGKGVRREDSYIDPEHARWVVQNTPPESWPGCIPRPAPAAMPSSSKRSGAGGVARVPRDARVAGSGPRGAGGGGKSGGRSKGKGREVARPDMGGKSFFWDD